MNIQKSGVVRAALGFVVLFCGVSVPEAASGQEVTTLRQEKLKSTPGKTLTVVTVNYAPGPKSAVHRHSDVAFAFILAGAIRSQSSDTGQVKDRALPDDLVSISLRRWRCIRIGGLLPNPGPPDSRDTEGALRRTAGRTSRLAGELHDTILQTVQATKMIADNARYEHATDPVRLREAIESISDWLAQATTEGRTALNALRLSTTQRNDLAESFERAGQTTGLPSTMTFVVSTEGAVRELHPIVRDEIYRIGCEAIRNAGLHSEGKALEVTLSYAHSFTVLVRDNGRGIGPEMAASGKPGHFGLSSMAERATRIHSKLRILSRPNAGTDVELIVPGKVAFREWGSNSRQWLRKLRSPFVRDSTISDHNSHQKGDR